MNVSITFSAVLGDGCDSVFAVDDVMISEGLCAGKFEVAGVS